MPQLLEAFPPVAASHAHTLILGSMPGAASLTAGRYYAHPRNQFWPLMQDVLGIDADLPYEQRLAQLQAQGFALWDVLGACEREGSLDTRIDPKSIQVNDFADFLAEHPCINRIFFNGAYAEKAFRTHALRTLPWPDSLQLRRLPSTSPANASLSLAQKRAAWRMIKP